MRRMLALPLAVAVALAIPTVTLAHAIPIASSPAEGSTLLQAPTTVEIIFGEAVDPGLSSITVLDSSGASVDAAQSVAVVGHPEQLKVSIRPLVTGVYVVTWRTVSTDDGHLAAGSFAFGVKVSPASANNGIQAQFQSPPPSPLAIVARWILLCALIVLIGLASTSVFALHYAPPFAIRLAVWGWLVSAVGTFGVAEAERESANVTWSQLFSTSLGGGVAWRVASIVLLGLVTGLLMAVGASRRRLWLGALGVAVALGLAVEVTQSHAAAKSPVIFSLFVQWLHVAAVGVWIGGLAVLLLTVWKDESGERGEVVRRFSVTAGICILIVGASGLVRALAEIPSWDLLFGSAYGILVLIKVGLFLVLAALGSINRFKKVPLASTTVRGLKRVASAEVVIAIAVLALAAGLVNVAPPTPVNVQRPPVVQIEPGLNGLPTLYTIQLTQGRTLQVYLDPGTPGPNEFHMTYFDNQGNELPVSKVSVAVTPSGGKPVELSSRPLDRVGHFVADASVSAGTVRFDVIGSTPAGEVLATYILVPVS